MTGFGIGQTVALHQRRVFGQYAVVYILNGSGTYEDDNGHRQNLVPGDLVVVFPELGHFYNPAPGTEWIVSFVCFRGPVFDLWEKQGILDSKRPVHHLEPVNVWSRKLEEVTSGASPHLPVSQILEICRVQQFLAEVLAETGKGAPHHADAQWASRACALVEAECCCETDWIRIAKSLGMTQEGFRKRFTRLVGQPPAEYRMRCRIDCACGLMQERQLTDKEIAERVGFCDEFYFSRRFKAVVGKSPRQFRESMAISR